MPLLIANPLVCKPGLRSEVVRYVTYQAKTTLARQFRKERNSVRRTLLCLEDLMDALLEIRHVSLCC